MCIRDRSLPEDATNLVRKRQEAVSSIDTKFYKRLEDVKVQTMKKGDLDGANAIQKIIDKKAPPMVSPDSTNTVNRLGGPIRIKAGMKLLWCPDAYNSAYFTVEEGGKIRSLDKSSWNGSLAKWSWESRKEGEFSITFGVGTARLKQLGDSLMFEGICLLYTSPSPRDS